jgi:hypothetical protein
MNDLNDLEMYSKLAQYYIEQVDNLNSLQSEADEFEETGEPIPDELESEIFRHKFIVEVIAKTGKEQFKKEPKQLYNDGWHFWFKEDAELREKRYGRK